MKFIQLGQPNTFEVTVHYIKDLEELFTETLLIANTSANRSAITVLLQDIRMGDPKKNSKLQAKRDTLRTLELLNPNDVSMLDTLNEYSFWVDVVFTNSENVRFMVEV